MRVRIQSLRSGEVRKTAPTELKLCGTGQKKNQESVEKKGKLRGLVTRERTKDVDTLKEDRQKQGLITGGEGKKLPKW